LIQANHAGTQRRVDAQALLHLVAGTLFEFLVWRPGSNRQQEPGEVQQPSHRQSMAVISAGTAV